MGKSMSTREKRALLMVKTKTTKQFDKQQLHNMREKYGASDINAMIEAAQGELKQSSGANAIPQSGAEKAIDAIAPQTSDLGQKMTKAIGGVSDWLVLWEKIDKYWVELPGSILPDVRFQDFNFLPDYQKHFHHRGHVNFLGVSPTLGPVVVSIMDPESEIAKPDTEKDKETTEQKRAHTNRSKSLSAFGSRKLKSVKETLASQTRKASFRESPKDAKEKEKEKDKSSRDSKRSDRKDPESKPRSDSKGEEDEESSAPPPPEEATPYATL